MTKFTVGQNVTANHPDLGGKVPGVVLFTDLKGRAPILVKCSTAIGEMCIQVNESGSNIVFPVAEKPATKTIPCFLILNADGTVLPFEPMATSRGGGTKMAAVIRADRAEDGSYSNFTFESFEDEAQAWNDVTRANGDMTDLPLDLKAVFEALFGKRDPKDIN